MHTQFMEHLMLRNSNIYENVSYLIDEYSQEICGIVCTINGQVWSVPLDPNNTDYANIMRLVEEGQITIK